MEGYWSRSSSSWSVLQQKTFIRVRFRSSSVIISAVPSCLRAHTNARSIERGVIDSARHQMVLAPTTGEAQLARTTLYQA
jgi:hypothetical protein